MKYLRVTYVEWIDSQTTVGWEGAEECMEEIKPTVSIGILVAESIDALVIANSYDPETRENNGRIYIPLAAIKKCRTLCTIQTKKK